MSMMSSVGNGSLTVECCILFLTRNSRSKLRVVVGDQIVKSFTLQLHADLSVSFRNGKNDDL